HPASGGHRQPPRHPGRGPGRNRQAHRSGAPKGGSGARRPARRRKEGRQTQAGAGTQAELSAAVTTNDRPARAGATALSTSQADPRLNWGGAYPNVGWARPSAYLRAWSRAAGPGNNLTFRNSRRKYGKRRTKGNIGRISRRRALIVTAAGGAGLL